MTTTRNRRPELGFRTAAQTLTTVTLTLTDPADIPRVVATWLAPEDGRTWWWATVSLCPVCLRGHRYGQPTGPGRHGWLRTCHGRPVRLTTQREARRA